MRFIILPLGQIYRIFHKGAAKILGKNELEDLKTDLVAPVVEFVDEVYDDTVGELMKDLSELPRKDHSTERF